MTCFGLKIGSGFGERGGGGGAKSKLDAADLETQNMTF